MSRLSKVPASGAHRATALAVALFVFGFGQELWFRYLPAYLRTLGASAVGLGLFGTLKDLLDAAYAYPGGVVSDRLGTRRALILFGMLSTAGFLYYSIRGFAVAGAAAVGGVLWTIRPSLTFIAAAALGIVGTLWAALCLPPAGRLKEQSS